MIKHFIQDSIDLLHQMVRIPSFSFEETEVCSIIEKSLIEWGLEPERIGNCIIVKSLKAEGKAPVLAMVAHIDTVPAAASYTRDPFDPGCDEERIWGLGSNDDGGSVVSMIAAFRQIVYSKAPVNLILVLSCEEERSGPNGAQLIFGPRGPFGSGTLPSPDGVIVGEPTSMKVATSERGLLVIDASSKGVSGHAARGEGVNAIYIAMQDIAALRAYNFDKHSELMGDVRLTVTQINAGTAHNVVPDSCNFVIDIRPTDRYSNAEILESLQAMCQSELKARKLDNKSSATLKDGLLYQTVKDMGLVCFSSPTTSDWIRIRYDAIKMGPGESSRSHRADEYILRSEIEEGVKIYLEFIQRFSYGNIVE